MVREFKSSIAILALIDIIEFNIDGIIIHLGLSILIVNDAKYLKINSEQLKQLQDRLKDIRYIIIDKKNIVEYQILDLVDIWLQQAFLKHNNKLFNGKSIILFGDFDQLSPILDLSMFTDTKQDLLFDSSLIAYKQFKEMYKLNII